MVADRAWQAERLMSDPPSILPGADAWSCAGGRAGALCLHGFTGNPTSMRPVAEAFAAAGFSVELPRLPGHGTTVEDMMTTGWPDWTAEAEAAYVRLAARTDTVVVVGQSMGGALTLWLAAGHPEIAGIVLVNPATQPQPPEMMEMVQAMLADGTELVPGGEADIAKPGVIEAAYKATPLRPLVSMVHGVTALVARYREITCPLLLMTSPQDHVLDPAQSDYLASVYGGPVERVVLERSFHVATLDHDAELVQAAAVAFATRVTSAAA
jgi:carboxylesterase